MDDRKWARVPLDVLQELRSATQEYLHGRTNEGSLGRLAHACGRLSFHLREAEAEHKVDA